jgi:hypothetical protein
MISTRDEVAVKVTGDKIMYVYDVIVHRRVAEDAKRMNIFLSADPGGIGSAFHRAEEGRKKKLSF